MNPASFNIVRLGLLGGVVLFGGAIWFLHQSGGAPEGFDAETATVLRYAFYAVAMGAAVVLVLVRQKATTAATFEAYMPAALVGLAGAEGVAFFGGVYWLLTGIVVPYGLGVLLFLLAFFAFPSHPPEA